MSGQPTHKLLVIEQGIISSMAGNPNFISEFPFLRSVSKVNNKKTGCGACSRRRTNQTVASYNAVKQAIVNMSPDKKKRLKALLNSEKIRVRVAQGGSVKEYTF
jgi:hypothetical protein